MTSKPSKLQALVFDEDGMFARARPIAALAIGTLPVSLVFLSLGQAVALVPFALVVFLVYRWSRKRTLVIGVEGFVLESRFGHSRFISFDAFDTVEVIDTDVIVRVTIDSNIRLRAPSFIKAFELRESLRQWFEIYSDLASDAGHVEHVPTTYREAACDPTWAIAFSPAHPIADRARAALRVLRDDRATHTVNAKRLATIAAASARTSFSELVDALVKRAPLANPTRIAHDLGLHVDELASMDERNRCDHIGARRKIP